MELSGELEQVARRLVDHPDELRVTAEQGRDGTTRLLIATAAGDRGQVIGRHGKTIRSLRALVALRDERRGEHHDLDVVDD